MCGISGIINSKKLNAKRDIELMAKAILSRGPDSFGFWANDDQNVHLAHRRLAIQDLSDAGHQPMCSASQRFILVFNGELYNFLAIRTELINLGYKFKGHSDTEVLLYACEYWGVNKAIQRFKGMFAFALFDQLENKIYLARDRLGEKPLFYTSSCEILAFSSELKSFNNLSFYKKTTNRASLVDFLKHGYTRNNNTLYENIFRLEPGEILTYDIPTGNKQIEKYWDSKTAYKKGKLTPFQGDENDALIELENLLNNSISGQMISDAPLGSFLSGGIDSSLITALASKQHNQNLDTFSMGFEDPAYNEADHARKIANYLGTNHHEITISEQDCLNIVPTLLSTYSEPFCDPSAIPTILLSQFAKQKVTVALSGDAGDELFWGYNRYTRTPGLWQKYKRSPVSQAAAFTLQKRFSILSNKFPKVSNKINRSIYLLGSKTQLDLYDNLRHIFTDFELSELVPEHKIVIEEKVAFETDELGLIPLTDINDYLTNDILVKVDRAAMAASLETRIPLLDHQLLEFSFTLPDHLKIKEGNKKYLLKKLLAQHVPSKFTDRPKKGFSVPLAEWLRTVLKDWAHDIISKGRKNNSLQLNFDYVDRLFSTHSLGLSDNTNKLWCILMLIEFDCS